MIVSAWLLLITGCTTTSPPASLATVSPATPSPGITGSTTLAPPTRSPLAVSPEATENTLAARTAAPLAAATAHPTPSTPSTAPSAAPSATPTLSPPSTTASSQATQAPRPSPQPLQTTAIVDRPFRTLRAITDGKRKYRLATWGPNTAWIAAIPQDGPGLDLINSRTAEVIAVLTDTYVLEPIWQSGTATPCSTDQPEQACVLLHRISDGADQLDRFSVAQRALLPEPALRSSGPIRAITMAGNQTAYSGAAGLVMQTTGAAPAVFDPDGALVASLAPVPNGPLAWTPTVTNLVEVQVAVASLADRQPRALTGPGEGWWLPRWSPDSTRLAVTNIDGRIGTLATDGSARYDLGPGDTPAWSPDGTRLAFAGSSAGTKYTTRDIHLVDWQGHGPRIRLTRANDEQFYVSPSWSPDGRQLAFVELDSGKLFVGDIP